MRIGQRHTDVWIRIYFNWLPQTTYTCLIQLLLMLCNKISFNHISPIFHLHWTLENIPILINISQMICITSYFYIARLPHYAAYRALLLRQGIYQKKYLSSPRWIWFKCVMVVYPIFLHCVSNSCNTSMHITVCRYWLLHLHWYFLIIQLSCGSSAWT